MTKKEFENLTGTDIDDDWFEKINTVFDTFEDITEGDLSEIWLNDSLCVMEDLYESACKFKSIKYQNDKLIEHNQYLKDNNGEILDCSEEVQTDNAKLAAENETLLSKMDLLNMKIDELETDLQQYRALASDMKNYKDGFTILSTFIDSINVCGL